MQRYGIVLAAAVIVAAAGSASAQGLLSAIGTGFWQGAWGTEGMTPVVTVSGQAVTYEGANKQTYPVSNVAITSTAVTFQAGSAAVSLTKRSDANADMVSMIGDNSSPPILPCKSGAPHCP